MNLSIPNICAPCLLFLQGIAHIHLHSVTTLCLAQVRRALSGQRRVAVAGSATSIRVMRRGHSGGIHSPWRVCFSVSANQTGGAHVSRWRGGLPVSSRAPLGRPWPR